MTPIDFVCSIGGRLVLCAGLVTGLSALVGCGQGTAPASPEPTQATVSPASDPGDPDLELRVGHIPRIIGPNESGEVYLRAASWGLEAGDSARVEQCPEAEEARRNTLRRGEGAGPVQIEWVSDPELQSEGQGGITQIRYRVSGEEGGDNRVVEGVLSLRYDSDNRRYFVSCPE